MKPIVRLGNWDLNIRIEEENLEKIKTGDVLYHCGEEGEISWFKLKVIDIEKRGDLIIFSVEMYSSCKIDFDERHNN